MSQLREIKTMYIGMFVECVLLALFGCVYNYFFEGNLPDGACRVIICMNEPGVCVFFFVFLFLVVLCIVGKWEKWVFWLLILW